MSLPTWIVLGLVAGFVFSKIIHRSGEGLSLDMILGIVGAIIGGLLFSSFGTAGMGKGDIYTFAVPVAGAFGSLVAYHFLMGRPR